MNRNRSSSKARVLFSYVAVYAKMAMLILLRRPYKLTLLVTDGCNLRCQVCSIWKREHTYVSLAEVQQIWSAFGLKPCWINISGGEPSLNPELADILSYFVSMKRSLLVTLTTNGQLDWHDPLVQVLARNRRSVLFVSVSVDGEPAVHDRVRGKDGSYRRALTTIAQLRSLADGHRALTVGISTTLSQANYRAILPFLAKRMRQLPVSVNLAQASPYYGNQREDGFVYLRRETLVRLLRSIQYLQPKRSLDAVLKINFMESVIAFLSGSYRPIPCSSVVDNVLVTAQLDRVDCSLKFRPWNLQKAQREEKLAALLDTIRAPVPRWRLLRRQVHAERCESCCHTPCEGYVHLLSALANPWLVWRLAHVFVRRTVESRLLGAQWVRIEMRRWRKVHAAQHRVLPASSAQSLQ